MKRQKLYLIVSTILAILAILAIVYKRGGFSKTMRSEKLSLAFAIQDTADVTKVFMANMFGEEVLLTKTPTDWMVDNQKPANEAMIKDLLMTMLAIRVAQPIAKNAQNSIIQMLAVSSTKVEIYETKPLFTLFGATFFTKERLSKTYYLGDATQNSLGSYASIEGLPDPYIVYKPGFRGYVTPLFTPKSVDWYSQRIFSTKLTQIQNASFTDIENPENSFSVSKAGPRMFTLYDSHNNIIQHYDTTLLINMLSEFREKYYEMFLHDMKKSTRDSIIQFQFCKTVSVTDVNNNTTTMNLYHLINEGDLYEDDELIATNYQEVRKDRFYATFNGNKEELYTIQFIQFSRQLQPLSYFLKK
jgi:hypothetical protein